VSQRFRLSAFADEIDPDLGVQLSTMKRLGVGGLDVRSVDNTNVTLLSEDQLARIKSECAAQGLWVESVGSPVNKVMFTPDNVKSETHKLELSIRAAHSLGVRKIRIFSPQVPEGQEEALFPEVVAYMGDLADRAKAADVVLLHENDGRFIGAYPLYARRMMEALGGPHFRFVYDFANGVPLGFRAMADWFPWLLPHLESVHIKDARSDGKVVPAGQGEGQLRETFEYLIGEGWDGTVTLEPHLQAGGPYGGFSGPQLFEVAVGAIRDVLKQAGGEG